MVDKIKAPYITNELIEYLDCIYKDKCPDIKLSDRQIWFDAGAVSVVRHLKHLKERQDENILKKDLG